MVRADVDSETEVSPAAHRPGWLRLVLVLGGLLLHVGTQFGSSQLATSTQVAWWMPVVALLAGELWPYVWLASIVALYNGVVSLAAPLRVLALGLWVFAPMFLGFKLAASKDMVRLAVLNLFVAGVVLVATAPHPDTLMEKLVKSLSRKRALGLRAFDLVLSIALCPIYLGSLDLVTRPVLLVPLYLLGGAVCLLLVVRGHYGWPWPAWLPFSLLYFPVVLWIAARLART